MSDDWYASSNPQSSGGFYPNYNQQYNNNNSSGSGGYFGQQQQQSQQNNAYSGGGGGYYDYGQQQPTAVPPANAFQTNPMNNPLSGPMGGPMNNAPPPAVFDPNSVKTESNMNTMGPMEEDYENEPPLLEELGVNFPHIYSKSYAVLFPYSRHAKNLEHDVMDDDDLAGPLAFALGLGGELLLAGKMQFGYVYGFGISGCIAMTLLLNLLNPNGAVHIVKVLSILGYALLPVNFLAGFNAILRIGKMGWVGVLLAVMTIAWCTAASTRLFERGCDMRNQRFLVAYPGMILYSAFVMITIF